LLYLMNTLFRYRNLPKHVPSSRGAVLRSMSQSSSLWNGFAPDGPRSFACWSAHLSCARGWID
jgi:hypothetical protein